MNKITIAIVAAIVVIAGSVSGFYFLSTNGKHDFQTIERATFKRTVEVSGKVAPIRDAYLGFESAGTINGVFAEVGDEVKKGSVLVSLDASSVRSMLSKARADLQAEIVTLNDLSQSSGSTELQNSKQSMVVSLQNAYSSVDNAVKTQTDQFFTQDPGQAYPKLIDATGSYDTNAATLRIEINRQRRDLGETLPVWRDAVRELNTTNLTSADIEYTKNRLSEALDFMDNVVQATNDFDDNSVLTDSEINSHRNTASSARSSVQSALNDVITKEESLRSVTAQIPVQQTKVQSAEANVQDYQVQLSKSQIIAPFDGIVSKQEAQVGEIAQSGKEIVSLISSEGLKLEVYIPEVNISDVSVGQKADVILDAYGSDEVFEAEIVFIDPIETEKEGISTYKTTFHFNNNDSRIRSGMTADVTIISALRENVLLIPRRAVIDGYVLVEENGEIVRRKVEVGEKDTFGNYEVLSGLEAGDKVVLNP